MANTVALKSKLAKETIAHLDANAVMTTWANRKYQGTLKESGKTVSVPSINRFAAQRGGTAGDDITTKDWAYTTFDLTVSQVAQDSRKIKDIEQVEANLSLRSDITSNFGYAISQTHERHIGLTAAVGADTMLNAGAPETISASNIHAEIEDMRVVLSKNNAYNDAALFIDPKTASFLRQADILDGFAQGLEKRVDGWVPGGNGLLGKMSKFTVYETNNLPYKVKLTLDTVPTADDTQTITLYDVEADTNTTITFTWKAVASGAGEITIGGTVAASQTNLINAIAGSGTGFVDASTANRALLDSYEVTLGAFASDIGYLYTNNSLGTISVAETYTAATNLFGTESVVLLAFDREAVNFVDQLTNMKVNPATSNNGFYSLLQYESVFQGAVLGRNAKRLVSAEVVR